MIRATAILLAVFCAAGASAQDDVQKTANTRVATRIIADRLMVRCELSSARKRIPIHLTVETDNPIGLQLHGRVFQGLEIQAGDIVTMHLPGFKIPNIEPAGMPDARVEMFNDITKYWAADLGEIPCGGSIGYELLKNYHVVFDLPHDELWIAPPAEKSANLPDDPDGQYFFLTEKDGVAWFPATAPEKHQGMFLLATSTYDTVIESTVARKLGKPAGDIGPVFANRIDFAPYVAFRPGSVPLSYPSKTFGATGINLFRHFRVDLDLSNMRVRFEPRMAPKFPTEDFEFFQALASDKAEPIDAWLTKYPSVRLSREGAELLLTRRIDEGAEPPEAVEKAVDLVLQTTFEGRRTTKAIDLMDKFEEFQFTRFVKYAAKKGLEFGRNDSDPNAVHKIHGRVGEMLMEEGEDDEAWRHLLSAAFGLKEDGPINLNLGLLYEKKGKLARAFSRYVQAVIKRESADKALEGLNRVQKKLGGTDKITIDAIERLIEGKVPGYRAASKFKPTAKTFAGRTCLAMLFTSSEIRERCAPDLAFDAVASFFPPENVAVIVYHLPMGGIDGLSSPIAAEAAQLFGVGGPTAIFNGQNAVPGTAQEPQKTEFYEEYKKRILEELKRPTDYQMDLSAKVIGEDVVGEFKVIGPERTDLHLDILVVEKGVLNPSKSTIVVHHNVVRGSVFADGTPKVAPSADGQTIAFKRSIPALTDELGGHLDELESQSGASLILEPTKIDARMLMVVAFITAPDGEVLQAIQVDVTPPEEK